MYCKITCGVSQGSFLRPILFFLDISDLCRSSSKLISIFADDTNLYISDSNTISLFIKISIFHCPRKRKDIPNVLSSLHIDNVPVKKEFTIKFLGIHLDKKYFLEASYHYSKHKSLKEYWNVLENSLLTEQAFTKQTLFFSYKLLLKLRLI